MALYRGFDMKTKEFAQRRKHLDSTNWNTYAHACMSLWNHFTSFQGIHPYMKESYYRLLFLHASTCISQIYARSMTLAPASHNIHTIFRWEDPTTPISLIADYSWDGKDNVGNQAWAHVPKCHYCLMPLNCGCLTHEMVLSTIYYPFSCPHHMLGIESL